MRKLYLDDAATTRVKEEVIKEITKSLNEDYGNPSSMHKLGEEALREINSYREKLASEINAKPQEIIFTSGGTESDNWAIRGIAEVYPKKKKIIISSMEHAAIVETCKYMEEKGYEIIKLKVDKEGFVNLDQFESVLDKHEKNILLVSVVHVNNITGTIQDIGKMGEMCRKRGVLFHTDAVQSFGKIDIDVKKMNIDLLSASGHKIGGPKGIGLLYIRDGITIKPLIFGGGQEKGLRSGTENVPGIVGFAKALESYKRVDKNKINKIRDHFMEELEGIGGKINGARGDKRIYNNVHVSFPGVDNSSLVVFLSYKGIYVSAGSACDSKREKEDHVLKAIGLNEKMQRGSIRITINEDIKEKDVKYIVNEIEKAIKTLKI